MGILVFVYWDFLLHILYETTFLKIFIIEKVISGLILVNLVPLERPMTRWWVDFFYLLSQPINQFAIVKPL